MSNNGGSVGNKVEVKGDRLSNLHSKMMIFSTLLFDRWSCAGVSDPGKTSLALVSRGPALAPQAVEY